MNVSKKILWGLCFICLTVFYSCNQSQKKVSEKPNIIFILADDMGYGDISCYNERSKIPTPHIDKLASQGIMFTDAHAPGAWCVPSRYGLLTGKYPGRVRLNWRERSLIDPDQITLGSMLQRNGYRTSVIGKWHLGFDNLNWESPAENKQMKGGPVEKGFDYFFGMHASLDIPPYFYIENKQVVQPPTGYVEDHASEDATTPISGAFYRAGASAPDFKHEDVLDEFLDKAIAFIDDHQTNYREQPFFLYFPLTAPHTPWLPKEKFEGSSNAGEYGDFVVQVDDLVGNMIAHLQNNGLLENTIVIFSSDNGPVWFDEDVEKFKHESTGPLKGMKVDYWEGGSRIPFIVSWPKRYETNAQTNQMICFTDIMATFADIIGDTTSHSDSFDSHSFLPVLYNPDYNKPVRNELVIEDKVYRRGSLKFIKGSGLGGLHRHFDPNEKFPDQGQVPGELYDLQNDLSEQNNLYDSRKEEAKKMEKELMKVINQDK